MPCTMCNCDFCIIFAEDKLHSAICKQAYIALVCIIFAKDKEENPH